MNDRDLQDIEPATADLMWVEKDTWSLVVQVGCVVGFFTLLGIYLWTN